MWRQCPAGCRIPGEGDGHALRNRVSLHGEQYSPVSFREQEGAASLLVSIALYFQGRSPKSESMARMTTATVTVSAASRQVQNPMRL